MGRRENFELWSVQLIAELNGEGLSVEIESTDWKVRCGNSNDERVEDRMARQTGERFIIARALEDSTLVAVLNCKRRFQLMAKLIKLFAGKILANQVANLFSVLAV